MAISSTAYPDMALLVTLNSLWVFLLSEIYLLSAKLHFLDVLPKTDFQTKSWRKYSMVYNFRIFQGLKYGNYATPTKLFYLNMINSSKNCVTLPSKGTVHENFKIFTQYSYSILCKYNYFTPFQIIDIQCYAIICE